MQHSPVSAPQHPHASCLLNGVNSLTLNSVERMMVRGKIMKLGGLTLKVEVELLVELKGAVVVLPILAEEGQEPLLCDL